MLSKIKTILTKIHYFLIKEEEFLIQEEKTLKQYFFEWFIPHSVNNHTPHATHRKTLCAVFAFVFIFKVVVLSFFIDVNLTYSGGISSNDIVAMTNSLRADKKLVTLTVNQDLVMAARLKAEDMFLRQYWSHEAPDGTTPWHWFDEVGYVYEYAGENLAMDFHTSDGVFKGWVDSRTHYENLVNPTFRETGVAVLPGIYEGKNTTIVVQLFGTQMKYGTPGVSKTPVPAKEETDNIPLVQELKRPTIVLPKQGAYVNRSQLMVRGEADQNVLVSILDDDMNLGKVPTDDYGYFSFRSPDLFDGTHNFKSKSEDSGINSDFSDPVTVIVDTLPPIIVENSLDVIDEKDDSGDDIFDIRINVMENPSKIEIVYGNKRRIMTKVKNDTYGAQIWFEEKKDVYEATIYANDEANNSSILDISLRKKKDVVVASNIEDINKINVNTVETDIADTITVETSKIGGEYVSEAKLREKENDVIEVPTNVQTITEDDEKSAKVEMLEPKVEKQLSKDINYWIYISKFVTFFIGFVMFLAYLMQAYVIAHKGLKEGNTHPVFHALSVLCIMIVIIII